MSKKKRTSDKPKSKTHRVKAKASLRSGPTELEKVATAIGVSQQLFQGAFDNAVIGMALVAPDGRWLQVNRALCEIVGYTEQELLATTFQAITHKDDLEADLNFVRQVLADEIQTYKMEKRYFHKLGHIVWILLSVSLVRDPQKKPVFFISQIQDITDRKQTEEALQASEAFMSRILESSPDCIKVLDLEGRLLFMNKGGLAIMEICDIASVLNTQWVEFWKGEDKQRASAALEAARAGGIGKFIGFCQTATGKPKWWDVCVTLLLDAHGAPEKFLAVSRDITERKRAAEERERLILQLQEAVSQVKVLQGILNICSWCKKICDEDGRWHPVENYIHERSHADFSHGICPECLDKQYKL